MSIRQLQGLHFGQLCLYLGLDLENPEPLGLHGQLEGGHLGLFDEVQGTCGNATPSVMPSGSTLLFLVWSTLLGLAPNGWPLLATDGFFDGRTACFFGRMDF